MPYYETFTNKQSRTPIWRELHQYKNMLYLAIIPLFGNNIQIIAIRYKVQNKQNSLQIGSDIESSV